MAKSAEQVVIGDTESNNDEKAAEGNLNVTEQDLASARALAETFSLELTRKTMANVLAIHWKQLTFINWADDRDPNFPYPTLMKIQQFLANGDVFENPDKHQDLIWEMKLEAALITSNSPYAEVRAVVDNHDDPSTPCSTIRAWAIGIFFSAILAAVNELFSIRQPSIYLGTNVAQLLAFPLGQAWGKFMPDYRFKLFGTEHSLNPGRFNKKEHIGSLTYEDRQITIMATAAQGGPYSDHIVWIQVLPIYFNQPWARNIGYRILLALSTNFLGYGLAGLTRKFIVYASYCMWPEVWNTGYIPILSNRVYDHFGKRYQVTKVLDDQGMYSHEKYMSYSAAYLGAANVMLYFCFFAVYSATITYVSLFHRHDIFMGLKNLWRSLRRRKSREDELSEGEYTDIHASLMNKYAEVSEYWYLGVLLCAAIFGFVGVAAYPTFTTPAVVPYGVLLAIIFVVPLGILRAVTGITVTLNVLAEFIGGMMSHGNALSMNLFKSFGYVTCAQALGFARDLKLAHYLKIPPRHTFAAQIVATLISTFVSAAIMQMQFGLKDVCTSDAPMRFTCPGNNTFFTAAVLWGTIGPRKVFGVYGQYSTILLGWPLGVITPVILYLLVKKYPRHKFLRQIHPVAFWTGPLGYTPYSFSYMWPQYNFVLSAAWSAGIAISGVLMLFTVQWLDIKLDWWGVSQATVGCEGEPCTLKTLAEGERFHPWWDGGRVPAP
ncbi:hypothetical protein SLS62_001653 [Diatrype stigma]|uniref:OPT oligopeptide transporter protein-domain-containing protein n=1 Tax=Diatrype stigma TaxID=117547 RepID=A0AAN9V0Q3_9PEZI